MIQEITPKKRRLLGWQLFNRDNETNATEEEIIEAMDKIKGKSQSEINEILNAFCLKHKKTNHGS